MLLYSYDTWINTEIYVTTFLKGGGARGAQTTIISSLYPPVPDSFLLCWLLKVSNSGYGLLRLTFSI